jgi:hypothetical protein
MNDFAQVILAIGVAVFLYCIGEGFNNLLGALASDLRGDLVNDLGVESED